MFLWYKTGVPFDNPVRLPWGRVKKEREKYGDVVYHQFPNGSRVRGSCYCYQVVFAVARLLKKRRRFTAQKLCRYAVLIAARQ